MLRTLREGRARRLLFLLGVVVFAAYGMVKSSCDFESNGESGSLTCHFSENIESLKYDFNVQHYYPQSSHVSPEYILDCMWSLIGRLNCRVLDDSYKFDSLVSDTLVIRIPQLTEHQEGRFACQVVPSEPGDIQPCMYNHSAASKTEPATESNLPELFVEEDDGEKTATCSSAVIGEPASVTCEFGEDVSQSNITRVSLLFYTLDDPEGASEPVVDCYWFGPTDLECSTKPGYYLNSNISDRMIVHIPWTRAEHEGKYVCQLVPPDGVAVCILKLNSSSATTQLPATLTDSSTQKQKDCQTPRSVENPCHNYDVLLVCMMPVLILLLLMSVGHWTRVQVKFPCCPRLEKWFPNRKCVHHQIDNGRYQHSDKCGNFVTAMKTDEQGDEMFTVHSSV